MRQKTSKIFRSSMSALALTLGLSVLLPGIGVDAKVGEKEDVFAMEYGRIGNGASYAAGFISLNSKEQSSSLSVRYSRVVDGPLISETQPQLKIFNKDRRLKFEIRDITTSKIDINPGTMNNNNIDLEDYIEWPTTYSNNFSKIRFLDLDKELWKYTQPGIEALNTPQSSHRTVYVGNGNFRVESKGTHFVNESNIVFPGSHINGAFRLYSNNMIILSKAVYVPAQKDFKVSVLRGDKTIFTANVKKGNKIANAISGLQGVQFQTDDKIKMEGGGNLSGYRFDGKTFKHMLWPNQKPAVVNAKNILITKGTPLTDEVMFRGVTATDGNGVDITNRVKAMWPGKDGLNTQQVGYYTRSYEVIDDNGSKATASRRINVVESPTIKATNIGIRKGTPITDEIMLRGVTARDGNGGDISNKIKVTTPGKDSVNTNKVGTYPIGYEVTDSNGIKVAASRTITIAEPPTITATDITLGRGTPLTDEAMLRGVTARDRNGADITSQIKVLFPGRNGMDSNAVGYYTRKYEVTDEYGITVVASRVINIVEVGGYPTISGTDITIGQGTPLTDEVMFRGITATDGNGADITSKIVAAYPGKNGLNTNAVGYYTRSYEVTDNNGVTVSITRQINVVPVTGALSIQASDITIGKGTPLTDEVMLRGVTATDENGVDFTHKVQPMWPGKDGLDTNTVGHYTRHYEATDDNGTKVSAGRRINVVALAEPFSVNAMDITIKKGTPLTDEVMVRNVTARDANGIDITYKMVPSSPGKYGVDTNVVGYYTRHYEVISENNTKYSATRRIHVVD